MLTLLISLFAILFLGGGITSLIFYFISASTILMALTCTGFMGFIVTFCTIYISSEIQASRDVLITQHTTLMNEQKKITDTIV
jgi:hypothetical protein